MKLNLIKFWNKNRLAILVLLMLGLSFIIYTTIRYIQAFQVAGQWTEFNSQDYMHGENNPDGFRLEYPQSWRLEAYANGGSKNFKDARLGFDEPYFLFTPNTFLYVWWRRVDENWTLEDVRDWYIEELGFGINRSELEQKRNSFQEVMVGAGNYPALSQVFWRDTNSGTRIVLFIVGDEAFILDFDAQKLDSETLDIFNRMLDSYEVYE